MPMLHSKYEFISGDTEVNTTPPSLYHICVAFCSDVHIEKESKRVRMSKFVDSVNILKPDLVLNLGDYIMNYGSSPEMLDLAWPEWNRIEAPKEFVMGNHDAAFYNAGAYTSVYDSLINGIGYADRPVICNSVFNRSFSVTRGGISLRVIMVDSNINADGTHGVLFTGALQDDALAWIASELANCEENVVFLCMHHGPHRYDIPNNFNADDAVALRDIVDAAVLSRPTLKVYTFFGHSHPKKYETYTNMGDNFPGYCITTLDGWIPIVLVYVLPDGTIRLEELSRPWNGLT